MFLIRAAIEFYRRSITLVFNFLRGRTVFGIKHGNLIFFGLFHLLKFSKPFVMVALKKEHLIPISRKQIQELILDTNWGAVFSFHLWLMLEHELTLKVKWV
ncbi:MAG: hypothetical protein JWQ35_1857 [Bacteriovoracaceae bacterium]|nr:hypothetical protein [Bacteriovoracaceae bacterium]